MIYPNDPVLQRVLTPPPGWRFVGRLTAVDQPTRQCEYCGNGQSEYVGTRIPDGPRDLTRQDIYWHEACQTSYVATISAAPLIRGYKENELRKKAIEKISAARGEAGVMCDEQAYQRIVDILDILDADLKALA